MNQENTETQTVIWAEEHPWLSQLTSSDDEDSVDEMIRFALDELRFA